jgi:hypothetical protein
MLNEYGEGTTIDYDSNKTIQTAYVLSTSALELVF